ncbi:PREDICTED: FAD-dependent oxidoreductase domain-containing protein 2-like [Priapulus caudatus]|uniref:FAD-dependent oxidoreductase domain-containing protein 2-like n=1 Tax=Priapulus caudatus TaxID=37621 RepID=A0ABM1EI94_PRICU|nr:PREDICTED: FAD-dependent oxidoreductase domain-containing protein 2-like [Priapulus caudatus]
MSVDPSDYEGQSVLRVCRNGNSAFESPTAIGAPPLVTYRAIAAYSWAVNNNLLDTYQLKSLDGIADGVNVEELAVTRDGDRLRVVIADKHGNDVTTDNYALREPYDRVINCLGFKYDFSLFNGSLGVQRGSGARAKYPAIGDNYEATTVPGLFFVGANTHSLDFRRSAGGFIHGFRYTARTLHKILERRNHGDAWPAYSLRATEIVAAILRRVNEASDLYQMFGVLADVIMLRDNKRRADYVEAFPINLLPEFAAISGIEAGPVIVIVLEYGKNFSGEGKDPFHSQRATGSYSHAHLSNFLHPVLYYYDALPTAADMASKPIGWLLPRPRLLHHVVEDFLTDWTALSSHVAPLRHFVDDALQVDTRWRFTDECFALRLTHASLPYACEEFYMAGRGLVPTTKHQRHLASQEYALSE